MSIRLAWAWLSSEQAMPTAVDDLESFFWVLIWAITYILEHCGDQNKRIRHMKGVLEDKDLLHTLLKKVIAGDFRHDAVFGGIIQEWMTIFDSASEEVSPYALRVSQTQVGSPDREQACNELEFFCKGVYKAVLESGFRHLGTIATDGYSCWNRVVEANAAASV